MIGRIDLRHQFDGFGFNIQTDLSPGVTALFGPSGAGKTSVLRAVAGLLRPDYGRVEINGAVWLDTEGGTNLPPHRRKIGYVFQEARLFPHLSVGANLRFGSRGATGHVRFDALVELLGLGALLDRRPAGLSGGEAQRVALGRALLSGPELLLMDEPLSGLDLARKREFLPYLKRLVAEAALPALYVSHDIDEVAQLAHQMILIDAGRIEAQGSVATVLAQAAPSSPLGRRIAGGVLEADITGFDAAEGLTELKIGAQRLWLPGQAGDIGAKLRLRVDAREVTLALARPEGISALNVLPVTITAIDPGPGAGTLIRLDHQGQALTARLTQRSTAALGLRPGLALFAILKTMAAAPSRLGG